MKSKYEMSWEKEDIGECYQYKRRVEKAEEESKAPYWEHLDLDLKKAIAKPIDQLLAKKIVEEYEWLGCMPAVNKYYYGIFFW